MTHLKFPLVCSFCQFAYTGLVLRIKHAHVWVIFLKKRSNFKSVIFCVSFSIFVWHLVNLHTRIMCRHLTFRTQGGTRHGRRPKRTHRQLSSSLLSPCCRLSSSTDARAARRTAAAFEATPLRDSVLTSVRVTVAADDGSTTTACGRLDPRWETADPVS